MAKKDLNDPWTALADILREVSWPIKVCVTLGLLSGGLGGAYLGGLTLHRMYCTLVGCSLLGAFVGLALGVSVDYLLQRIFPRDDK